MAEPKPNIRALIFDFGGVLMRTVDRGPRRRLASRFGLSVDELEELVFGGPDSLLADTGGMSSEERWRRVSQRLDLPTKQAADSFVREFFSGEALDDRLVDHIRMLHREYKTALLSNASDSLDRFVREELGLEEVFDVIIISALVGVRKPDALIYQLALERLGVSAGEALFVDDLADNVEGARKLGLQAIQFRTKQQFMEDLQTLLARGA
jgi:epoxide hydrolase-like predicted phosphatase